MIQCIHEPPSLTKPVVLCDFFLMESKRNLYSSCYENWSCTAKKKSYYTSNIFLGQKDSNIHLRLCY